MPDAAGRVRVVQASWYGRWVRRLLPGLLLSSVALLAGCGSGTAVPPNEFGDCVFEPNASCTEQDFTAIDLSDLDMTGGNFAGSDFTAANLRGAVLRDADLSGATLTRADLTDADLRGADLTDAVVFSATFEGAEWQGASRSGMQTCETVLPDGDVSDCPRIDQLEAPVNTSPPPTIVRFEPQPPATCLHDGLGVTQHLHAR